MEGINESKKILSKTKLGLVVIEHYPGIDVLDDGMYYLDSGHVITVVALLFYVWIKNSLSEEFYC